MTKGLQINELVLAVLAVSTMILGVAGIVGLTVFGFVKVVGSQYSLISRALWAILVLFVPAVGAALWFVIGARTAEAERFVFQIVGFPAVARQADLAQPSFASPQK